MRVHGTKGGSGRRRERRFGGSSSLFRPTTGTPTGCELFAADDATLIHGVKGRADVKVIENEKCAFCHLRSIDVTRHAKS